MATQYFRIDGADSQSGQETYLVLRAESKPHAERLARKQGILVSSVRIAKSADWKRAQGGADTATAVAEEPADIAQPEPLPEPEVGPVPATAPQPAAPSAEPTAAPRESRASSGTGAAAILLSFIGAALVIGGVLALSLALWPDEGVRNELQQVDFRLHELSQTILGSMLVLGGLLIFVLAALLSSIRSRSH